ncbi:TolC family protein [Sorangium sp. So ce296]|uniref:TolC family protein n=1 Tax=Sorangium sp. So ce296 TaxID=3133296 RepID=UPI003F5D9C0F
MGPLRVERVLLAALGLALAGCYAPSSAPGVERAVALYRQDRARGGAHPAPRGGPALRPAARAAAGAAPGTLTVDQAVAMARDNSPRLAELTALADAAEAAAAAESHHENPELRVSQLRLDEVLAGEPRLAAGVRFRPARPGEIDAEVAAARAEEAAARAEAHAEVLAVEADIRWLFDDAILLEAEIAAADAVVAVRRAIAANAKTRVQAAAATALDEAKAELSAIEAEQDSVDHRARLRAVRGELLERVGLDPAAPVRLVGDPLAAWPPPALPSEDALIETALRNRLEVAAAAAQIDAADAQAFIERRKRWPWFSFLELGYEFSPGTERGLGWTFEAGIELPIFNSNRSATLAAETATRAARSGLAAQVRLVAREVRARLREVEAAATLVTELRARALPVAERAATAARRALEDRALPAVDALSTDEQRLEMEIKLLELLRRHRTALTELRRAVGGHLPAAPGGAARR